MFCNCVAFSSGHIQQCEAMAPFVNCFVFFLFIEPWFHSLIAMFHSLLNGTNDNALLGICRSSPDWSSTASKTNPKICLYLIFMYYVLSVQVTNSVNLKACWRYFILQLWDFYSCKDNIPLSIYLQAKWTPKYAEFIIFANGWDWE